MCKPLVRIFPPFWGEDGRGVSLLKINKLQTPPLPFADMHKASPYRGAGRCAHTFCVKKK